MWSLYTWIIGASVRRRNLVSNAIFSAMIIGLITAVIAALWIAALPAGETVAGYSAITIIWYVAIAEAIVNGVDQRLMVRLGDEVRAGRYELDLLRPANSVSLIISREIGRTLVRYVIMLVTCCLVALALVGPPPSYIGLVTVAFTGPLAIMVQMLFITAASSSALWFGDTTAGWFFVQKLVFLLGGMLLPLEVWPDSLSGVLKLLPFASMAWVPSRIAVMPEQTNIVGLVALQIGWVIVLTGACYWLWHRGEQRFLREGLA